MDNSVLQRVKIAENRLNELPFTFEIDGQQYTKRELQVWQRKEYLKTAALLNRLFSSRVKLTGDMPFVEVKGRVIVEKMRIGQDALKDELVNQTRLANLASVFGSTVSLGMRRTAIADIYLADSPISAREMMMSFDKMMTTNSELNQFYNFKANPNHFYSFGNDEEQTVVEMTGGTRIANQFTLRYGDEKGLKTKRDLNFKFQDAGSGKLADGFVIGGVRHEMTDEGANFHARLQVEFPAVLPAFIIHQHAIHLLVEFSNWFTDIVIDHEN